jgi:hypothetical protein
MKVAFVTNHISYGGTDVSLYDYAHFNETLLGNTSVIVTRDFRSTYGEIYAKFQARFPVFFVTNWSEIDDIAIRENIDVVYIQKSGEIDGVTCRVRKCCVHAVFDTRHPHGDVYAAISSTLNSLYHTRVPVVPYMVHVDDTIQETFREELGIPQDAIVIGRHGSYDTFDIEFVHRAIPMILDRNPNMYFVALNTKPFAQHPRLFYLPRTIELSIKRKFVNTCDVMLHARARGETFGLSCGEFAVARKPIVTCGLSLERAHIDLLGNACTTYTSLHDLVKIFEEGTWKKDMSSNGYLAHTPQAVMPQFRDVFLLPRPSPLSFLRSSK